MTTDELIVAIRDRAHAKAVSLRIKARAAFVDGAESRYRSLRQRSEDFERLAQLLRELDDVSPAQIRELANE